MTQTWPASLDYSYSRPSMQSLTDYGAEAVLRYLGDDSRCLTVGERDQLLGAGLGIAAIWETYARRPVEGWNAGVADAQSANWYCDQLGAPGGWRIYYAVDFQPTEGELYGPIADYFRGVLSVAGRPERAYGCASVLEHLCGVLRLFPDSWQCGAWSYPGTAPGTPIYDGGYNLVLSPYATIFQTLGYVLGDSCDHNNDLVSPPHGMWGIASGDWFDMATQEDLRRICAEECEKAVKKYVTMNALWQDDEAQWEVNTNGEGQRVKRRLKSAAEVDLLKVGKELTSAWVVDLTKSDQTTKDVFASWPVVPE